MKFTKNCELFSFYVEPPPPFLRGEGDGAAVHSLNFNELGETK